VINLSKSLKVAVDTWQTHDHVSVLDHHGIAPFIPQANNYGESSFRPTGPSVSSLLNSGGGNHEISQAGEAASVGSSQLVFSQSDLPPSATESERINVNELNKPKRQRKVGKEPSPEWLASQKKPFTVFAQELLADEGKLQRIASGKKAAAEAGFPLLRVALGWNTTNRVRAISYDLFAEAFQMRVSWSKSVLISKFLEHIQECNSAFPVNIAQAIADIGLVHSADEALQIKEIVFLHHNGKSSSGESCVLLQEELSGWVVRNREFVFLPKVRAESIHICRLVERCKSMSISSSGS
jgi:hypothetical protein